MAVPVDKRKTITVTDPNWVKYCHLKSEQLRKMGRPELSFSEFANASMQLADISLNALLELRRKKDGRG